MLCSRFSELFEWERFANGLMLTMLASVPFGNRNDPKFCQAVRLAAHIVSCRENWLDRMDGNGDKQGPWFQDDARLDDLPKRFEQMEKRWTEFFESLTDDKASKEFEFTMMDGRRMSLPIEIQVIQLICHTPYHRGQIATLVDQLGGETVDTDFLYWFRTR